MVSGGFYSALGRAVELDPAKSKPAAAWVRDLQAVQKKGGFKLEEADDLGLFDWLAGMEGKVSKEQVQQFIRDGGPKIEEVIKGGENFDIEKIARERYDEEWDDPKSYWNNDWLYDAAKEKASEEWDGLTEERQSEDWDDDFDSFFEDKRPYEWFSHQELVDIQEEAWREAAREAGIDAVEQEISNEELAPEEDQTKFSQWQLPGGENYREVLLTLPEGGYKSHHWSEPNVLAHFRLNDRTDADGRKTLFIEEIQSDWHQKGRKSGYNIVPKVVERDGAWYVEMGGETHGSFKTKEDAEYHIKNGASAFGMSNIPNAPFKKSWPLLAFKRILRMAAEEGYDAVAWTPGSVQAERYTSALQDAVNSVSWADGKANIDTRSRGKITFNFDEKGIISDASVSDANGKTVDELLGKSVAQQVLGEKSGTIDREGLFIGSELYRMMYDSEGTSGGLPKEVGAYVKKLDPAAQVGTTTIDAGDYKVNRDDRTPPYRLEKAGSPDIISRHATAEEAWAEAERLGGKEVWSLPITDTMRGSILAGQPLYSRAGGDAGTRIPMAELQALADDLARFAKNAGPTIPVQSVADMAPSAQREYRRILAEAGGKGRIRAMFYQGATYLIADNTTSASDALAGWMHDQAGHGGVRKLFPSERQFRNVLDLVYRSIPLAERRKIAKLYGITGTDLDSRLKLADEHLGRLAEKVTLDETMGPKERPAWRRFWDALKNLWDRIWRKITGRPLSEKDIAAIVRDAARLVIRGKASGEARAIYEKATGEPVMGLAGDLGRPETRASVGRGALRGEFGEQLDRLFSEGLPRAEVLNLGRTPDVLRNLGAEDLPLAMTQATARKISEKHGISVEMMKRLPEQIASPVAVFDSATQGGGLVVLTELRAGDNPVIAAVHLEKVRNEMLVNDVASAYGKDGFGGWLEAQHQAGRWRYVDKKKLPALLRRAGLQLPGKPFNAGSKNPILTDADIVKGAGEGTARASMEEAKDYGRRVLEAARGWARVVEGALRGRMDKRAILRMGTTPDLLVKVGIPSLPMVMEMSTLDKVTGKEAKRGSSHNLTEEQVKALYEEMSDPLAVTKYGRDNYTVVTRLSEGGNPVIVGLNVDTRIGRIKANEVASAYGKGRFGNWLLGKYEADELIYLNKKETAAVLEHMSGPQLAGVLRVRRVSGRKLLTEGDVVKPIFSENEGPGSGRASLADDAHEQPRDEKGRFARFVTMLTRAQDQAEESHAKARPSLFQAARELRRQKLFESRDLRRLEKMFRQPYWLAKEHPEFKALLDAEIRRENSRNEAVMRSWQGVAEAVNSLDSDGKEQLNRAIWAIEGKKLKNVTERPFQSGGKNDKGRATLALNEAHYGQLQAELERMGATPEVAAAVVAIRRSLDTDLMTVYNRLAGMREVDDGDVDRYRKQIGHIPNYFPHVRYGDHFIKATDPKTGDTLYREHFYAPPGFSSVQAARYMRKVQEKFPDAKWEWGKVQGLPEEVWEYPIPVDATEQVIKAAVDKLKGDSQEKAALKQAMHEATADVFKERVQGKADIKKDLKRRAKAENYRALIAKLEGEDLLEYYPMGHKNPDKRGMMVDPLQPWNSRIAMGMSKLGRMAAKGELHAPGFEDFIEALGDDWRQRKADEEDAEQSMPAMTAGDPRLFPLLSSLMSNDLPGAGLAGMIFKAIRGREVFIKGQLGPDYRTWESVVPEGYARWKPSPGTAWYMGKSLTERALEKVLAGEQIGEGDVRDVLMRGRDEEWVIPENLAAQLDQVRTFPDENVLSRMSSRIVGGWKQWTLLNPARLFRYNLNNQSGDADIVMAYNPAIFKEAPRAAKDLAFATRSGKLLRNRALRDEIEQAERLGVLSSAWSINEVQDVTGALGDQGYVEFLQQSKLAHLNLAKRYWKEAKDFTRYRENILRLAAFRWFKQELAAGKKLYGASDPAQVDQITNTGERAAKLARELIGDYGAITVAGQWIRKHMIPFYSWLEINAPRYVRMFRNLGVEGREESRGRAAAVGLGALAWKGTTLGLRASALFGLVQIWNWTFFPDESEEIGQGKRQQSHLILGRNKDKSIRSIRLQGALADTLSWFGLENPVEDARALLSKEKTWKEQGMDAIKAPVFKVFQGTRPIERAGIEAILGMSSYPDLTRPRPIRDRAEFLMRTWSVDSLYRHLAGKPTRPAAEELFGLVGYTTDPGLIAYYDTTRMVREYKEKHVRGGDSGVTVIPGDRSNNLYYLKQALRWNDEELAKKFTKDYFREGGTKEGMQKSLRGGVPISDLDPKELADFMNRLSPAQMKTVERGVKWYYAGMLGQALRGKLKSDALTN